MIILIIQKYFYIKNKTLKKVKTKISKKKNLLKKKKKKGIKISMIIKIIKIKKK